MVTQQILVLFFLVRIRVAQLKSRALLKRGFFFVYAFLFILNPIATKRKPANMEGEL